MAQPTSVTMQAQSYLNISIGLKNNKHHRFCRHFCCDCFAISLAGKALTKLANFASLGILNKLAGGFFGGLKAVLLISVVLLVFDGLNTNLTIVSEADIKASILYKKVQSLAPIILPSIIGENTPLEFTDFP